MYLITGLGNPGTKYSNTRHNIGFMIIDALAKRHRFVFRRETKYDESVGSIAGQKVVVIKPQTFMNLSGQAFVRALFKYKISLESSLTICDDINLPFGTIRIRSCGSHGGQNGLRSIIEQLNSQEFPRMRIGIGDDFNNAADYVLSKFKSEEKKVLPEIIECAVDAIDHFVSNGIELTMSRFNKSALND
jgi:peptidyl-tRNA hydrolase, PTH1 family